MKLDPAAVGAAAESLCIVQCGDTITAIAGIEADRGSGVTADDIRDELRDEAAAAITAYQRHQAAAVRDNVAILIRAVIQMAENPDMTFLVDSAHTAKRNLLALVGAQEDAE